MSAGFYVIFAEFVGLLGRKYRVGFEPMREHFVFLPLVAFAIQQLLGSELDPVHKLSLSSDLFLERSEMQIQTE